MKKLVAGVILIIVGVIGLAFVYSMRPPVGLGEAFMMMGQGRQTYIKEPFYTGLMAFSGLMALFGAVLAVAGLVRPSLAQPTAAEVVEVVVTGTRPIPRRSKAMILVVAGVLVAGLLVVGMMTN